MDMSEQEQEDITAEADVATLHGRVEFLMEMVTRMERQIINIQIWKLDHEEIEHGRKPREPPEVRDRALLDGLDRHLAGVNHPEASGAE
jgi:hypothetical protein